MWCTFRATAVHQTPVCWTQWCEIREKMWQVGLYNPTALQLWFFFFNLPIKPFLWRVCLTSRTGVCFLQGKIFPDLCIVPVFELRPNHLWGVSAIKGFPRLSYLIHWPSHCTSPAQRRNDFRTSTSVKERDIWHRCVTRCVCVCGGKRSEGLEKKKL